MQFKLTITKIDSARIDAAFVDNITLGAIHKIDKKTPIKKAYTQATPQIIPSMTIFYKCTTFESF